MPQPIAKNSRVNEIDLLRFVAVMAVTIHHYAFRGYAADDMSIMPYPLLAPIAQYGYLGVHLFFMISGFVILMTAGSGDLRKFIVSRIARLYPAFWVCCTITFISTLIIGGTHYHATVTQYLANMTMLGDFIGIEPIDGAYWSLFVEMQFYAFVAIVLAFGKIHKAQLFLTVWLGLVSMLDLLHIEKFRFLLITNYAGFFIAGATFYLIWTKGLSPARIGMLCVAWAQGLYEATTRELLDFDKHYHTHLNVYIVGGIITAFFLVMLAISLNKTGWFRQKEWMLAGAITYPLYLLHQNIGFMFFNVAYPAINPHLLLWGTISLSILAAYFVNVSIERRLAPQLKTATNNLIDFGQKLILRAGNKKSR
jgi:peptidoglycan/LPS O-acetylase OafA/YrhL